MKVNFCLFTIYIKACAINSN